MARQNDTDARGTPAKLWVAIEGPCCAGKTTLSRALARALRQVRTEQVADYADHVGGGRFLPRAVPESVDEDQDALRALLSIETDRLAAARANRVDLVLMDRSVHTLLAHRHALEIVTGLACLAPARRAIALSTAPAWPDLVLYLDVPQQSVHDRNRGKFPADSIFIDAAFNAGIRDYFDRLTNCAKPDLVWLDATLDPAELVSIAEARIRPRLAALAG